MIDADENWIRARVPEAASDEMRATMYAIGRHLTTMLGFYGDRKIPTDEMRVSRYAKACAKVVTEWDALMRALDAHPTYELIDHQQACDRHGVDLAQAERYAKALREIMDRYRLAAGAHKHKPDGNPRSGRIASLIEAAEMVASLLGTSKARSAAIVADLATERLGIDGVSADSLAKLIEKRKARS